jgi:hypothetical protein
MRCRFLINVSFFKGIRFRFCSDLVGILTVSCVFTVSQKLTVNEKDSTLQRRTCTQCPCQNPTRLVQSFGVTPMLLLEELVGFNQA